MAIYDTNRELMEPGIKVVTVISEPEETYGDGWVRIGMEFSVEGMNKPLKQNFFPNQLRSMFETLGFPEVEPGKFDGDIHEAYGKTFKAELYFETYNKKDGTTGQARKLRNFELQKEVFSPNDIPWDDEPAQPEFSE